MRRWLYEIFLLDIIVFTLCLSGCTTNLRRVKTNAFINYNGIYQSEKVNDYWGYLRFYDDGTVIAVSSTGTPKEISRWFNKENSERIEFSTGHYTIENHIITFSVTSSRGTVDYEGIILDDTLILDSYSHINEYQDSQQYDFVRF
jgi:hypothetical protein